MVPLLLLYVTLCCCCCCCDASSGRSSGSRRRELFAAYLAALQQVVAQRLAKAEGQLVQLLVKLNVGPGDGLGGGGAHAVLSPGCGLVPADRRAELFDERVREVRGQGGERGAGQGEGGRGTRDA